MRSLGRRESQVRSCGRIHHELRKPVQVLLEMPPQDKPVSHEHVWDVHDAIVAVPMNHRHKMNTRRIRFTI